jgi:hypothetical protein
MPKTTGAKSKTAKRVPKKKAGAAATASRNSRRPAKKQPTLEELTLRSFRLAYEQHHRKTV